MYMCTTTHTIPQSHAGKVVQRSWYERNKHIFPASRWEPYDPEKNWGTYSVSSVVYIVYDYTLLHKINTHC